MAKVEDTDHHEAMNDPSPMDCCSKEASSNSASSSCIAFCGYLVPSMVWHGPSSSLGFAIPPHTESVGTTAVVQLRPPIA
ncbi:hypothetical protein [Pseudovibrio flavus]|uniref:hypothetical protein n=1 Tax=Pseudovibrio flavus TaxID=2529854 RepID=UPI00211C4029|nr:hypothetical protein [Pseudovibrio flavus]